MGKGTHSALFHRARVQSNPSNSPSNLAIPRGCVLTCNVFRTIPRPVNWNGGFVSRLVWSRREQCVITEYCGLGRQAQAGEVRQPTLWFPTPRFVALLRGPQFRA